MTSSVNSMPASNTTAPGNASTQNPGGRPSLRPSASTRVSDGSRRQAGSPLDGTQRRSNSQKAWTSGTNPITQRSTYSQQNGSFSQKQSPSPRPTPKESNTPDSHAHDRLVFLFTSFIGLTTTITTEHDEQFTGIFSSVSLEPHESTVLLKMVQRTTRSNQQRANGTNENSSPFLGSAPNHSVAFDIKDIRDIAVANVSTSELIAKSSSTSAGFKTDMDISGNLAIRERTLKRWEPSADTDVDLSLESSNTAGWDQFEANARLFGATSSYDEHIYTTRIDRSDPSYKQKEAEAARIAREIEGTEVDNAHVMEERGLVATGDGDEEDKYSGVRRDENFPPLISGQPNKYTPPARRQAAAQAAATVAGAAATTSKPAPTPSTAPAKEAPPSQPQPPTTTTSATPAESEPKPAPAKALVPPAAASKRTGTENASANVETEVLDHFRQFANSEKAKLQERRRNQASYDRTIKLNELMKFSQNFKLGTPVPKDLVPILAKDPHKQEEIIQRAQKQADEKSSTKSTPPTTEQKPVTRPAGPARQDSGTMPSAAAPDRSNYARGRQMYPPTGPHAGPTGRVAHQTMHAGRQATGMLGHRLADNIQQRKGAAMGAVPPPLPIHDARAPPTGPAGDQPGVTSPNKAQTPTSAVSSKFNVRAMEFKPNPAASTFTPGASSNSSPFVRGRSVSRATSPSAFFGGKKPKPATERPSLNDLFNPIKRMKKENAGNSENNYAFNGGIPPAFKTPPTWDVPSGNEEKTYQQMVKPHAPNRSASNPQGPNQPQMPFQFAQSTPGMGPASGPPHAPHMPPQQHHASGPHLDDPHRMQMSASTSQIFPSPRLQTGYPSPMAPPPAQLAFGQNMPQFYVNPNAPQPGHMRHYPGAPQFVNPQATMGAPMMVQHPSSGSYMGVPQGMAPYTPQMQMYSPNPGHAYPQPAPPQPHSGYPSPSRGAPMMMHQNSQPVPPVRGNYQQPHFQSSPHQVHYPPHQHRTPSSGYNQLPQMPPQGPAQSQSSVTTGPQTSEATEETK
ncbi:hypothetical protein BJX96DRAFT_39782 [Aspergillus floccosus]